MDKNETINSGSQSSASRGYTKAELNRRIDYCEDSWIGANNAISKEAYALAADLMEKCVSQMNLCIHDCRVLSCN